VKKKLYEKTKTDILYLLHLRQKPWSFIERLLSSGLQTHVCVTHRLSRHERTESTVRVLVRHKEIGYTGPETFARNLQKAERVFWFVVSKMDTQAQIHLKTTYCMTPLARKFDAYLVQTAWGNRKYTAQERCMVPICVSGNSRRHMWSLC
jgi:hypothetical protein